MTSEELRMAFDPGFSTKDGGQGGLGLAISSLMTEAHGGHLELRPNAEGGGLSAIVWLPAVRQPAHDGPAYDDLAGLAVILAMPDAEPAEALANQLERQGCRRVAEVYTADELSALIDEDPDWQVVLVAPGFPVGRLPASLHCRSIPDGSFGQYTRVLLHRAE